eukprot:CAMPEP_0117424638 /NCGR_PEP_ID=MMETSP0758-20121206/5020_1 /TAXON_ID=63605 /ORGANISM="Percolomonas cosmopolitus, Strain AE-1 (ATCC 50343)" /LENGTH=507 /DNA_ID=CAMNT_0005208543 /DNA_START=249 /DNA_END=1769 /DNA_ORIENTATION=-
MTAPVLETSRNSSMLMSPNISQQRSSSPVTSKRRISSPVRYTASPPSNNTSLNHSHNDELLQQPTMSPIKTKEEPMTYSLNNSTHQQQTQPTTIELDQVTKTEMKHAILEDLYTILAGEFDISLSKLSGMTHDSGDAETSYYRYLHQQPTQKLMKAIRLIKDRFQVNDDSQASFDLLQKTFHAEIETVKNDVLSIKRAVALVNEKQDANHTLLKGDLEKVERYSKLVHEYQKDHIAKAMDQKAIAKHVDDLIQSRSLSKGDEKKVMTMLSELQADVTQQNKVIQRQQEAIHTLSSTQDLNKEVVRTKHQLNLQSQDIEGVNDQLIKLNALVNDLRAIISRQARQIDQLQHQNKALSHSLLSQQDDDEDVNDTPLDSFVTEEASIIEPSSNNVKEEDHEMDHEDDEEEEEDDYDPNVRVVKLPKHPSSFCFTMFSIVLFFIIFLSTALSLVYIMYPEDTLNTMNSLANHPQVHSFCVYSQSLKESFATQLDAWLSIQSSDSPVVPPAH